MKNKPGPAQVGSISKAQKQQKDFQVSSILFYSTQKSKILRKKIFRKNYILKQMAPGALKVGQFQSCRHFCRSVRGFVAKHQKIEGGKIFLFGKKSHSAEKN